MAWYQFDWKARWQLCATGSTAWGTQDPWNLISVSSGHSSDDPFYITPPFPFSSSHPPGHPASVGTVSAVLSLAGNNGGKRRNGICHLFNHALMGCPYGETCKFVHRCSLYCRTDHGKRHCLDLTVSSGPSP